MTDLKSKIKFVAITDSENVRQLRFLDLKDNHKSFSKDTSDLCRAVYENIIQKEVSNFEKDIKTYLNFAEKHQKASCERSINDVIGLFENSKYKQMEDDTFSIYQNILSCLNYNDKIEKEIQESAMFSL